MNTPKDPIVIYHGNCPDGFTGAWVFHRWITELGFDPPELFAATYEQQDFPDVKDRDVFVVDFSYSFDETIKIIDEANMFVMLDHHKSAYSHLKGFIGSFHTWDDISMDDDITIDDWADTTEHSYPDKDLPFICINKNFSGAELAAKYTGANDEFIDYIGARDLWQLDRFDDVDEVTSAINSYPFEIDVWDNIATKSIDELYAEGIHIVRYRNKLIKSQVALARTHEIDGHEILIAPSPYMIGSDVAGELAKLSPSGIGGYYVDWPQDERSIGLRTRSSDSPDVSLIAENHGGGGHAAAAAFREMYRFYGLS